MKICKKNTPDILIDVGTGSGIIPISILSEIKNLTPTLSTRGEGGLKTFAVDISSEALAVASKNCRDVLQYVSTDDITFQESNLLEIFLKNTLFEPNKNILITANLPYIKADDWENMSPDTHYEPEFALFGGDTTGFELYEKLFAQIPEFLSKYTPKSLTLLTEMGDDQKELATQVLESYGWNFSFFADLRGIERFIKIVF